MPSPMRHGDLNLARVLIARGEREHALVVVRTAEALAGANLERVVDRVPLTTGASCAFWAIRRAICAASAPGAGRRVSRNEQAVGSIPTGGALDAVAFR